MLLPELIAAAGLGLILGSFLNALLYRYNTGSSVMRGRSRCMSCNHTLTAFDLIPVLSYLFLRGKCRYCRSKISWQYPLVEVLCASLAVGTYIKEPEPARFALLFCLWLSLVFIVVYDLKHKIIPWSALIVFTVLSLLYVLVSEPSLLAFLSGPLLALPLFTLSLVSKGTWMGWGDGALELGIGWFLGLTMGLTALFLSFWIGAIVGIVVVVASRAYTMRSEVPFAPFLAFGAACAYFLHVDLFQALPALLPF